MKFITTIAYAIGFIILFLYLVAAFKKPLESSGLMIPMGTDWLHFFVLPVIISYFSFVSAIVAKHRYIKLIFAVLSLISILFPFIYNELN